MPAFQSFGSNPPALYSGDSFNLFNNELSTTLLAGSGKSQEVALSQDNAGGGRMQCVVELSFSAPPGNFEVDIEFAETDSDAYFIAPAVGGQLTQAMIGANNPLNVSFQYDAPGVLGRFMRAHLISCTNAVNITAKVTR